MDPTINVATSSGMLRVTIHPARAWPLTLLGLGVLVALAAAIYQHSLRMSYIFRGAFIIALVAGLTGFMFQLSGTETIEIDANKITLGKDIHGWERKREYRLSECRELEWMEPTEDASQRLQFKIGLRTVTFAKHLTESQAVQILTALQQTLPTVAQQLCSYPEGKKHFITLELS
jgi:hypothetical protein